MRDYCSFKSMRVHFQVLLVILCTLGGHFYPCAGDVITHQSYFGNRAQSRQQDFQDDEEVRVVQFFYPSDEKTFTVGQSIDILYGIRFIGKNVMKVKGMAGILTADSVNGLLLQNFTVKSFDDYVITQGMDHTLEYIAATDINLQATKAVLTVTMNYEVDGESRSKILTSESILLLDRVPVISTYQLTKLMCIGIFGMFVLFFIKRRVENVIALWYPQSTEGDEEWVEVLRPVSNRDGLRRRKVTKK